MGIHQEQSSEAPSSVISQTQIAFMCWIDAAWYKMLERNYVADLSERELGAGAAAARFLPSCPLQRSGV